MSPGKGKKKGIKTHLDVHKIGISLDMLEEFIYAVKGSESTFEKEEKAKKALGHLKKLCKDLRSVEDKIEKRKKKNKYYNKGLGKLEVVLSCDCWPKKGRPA